MVNCRLGILFTGCCLGLSLVMGGCTAGLRQQIRAHDFRMQRAPVTNEDAPPSPIADVPGMPDWTTDLEAALAFTRVNGGSTVVFLYQSRAREDEQLKPVLNDPRVISASQGMQHVAVDIRKRPEVASSYGVSATPAVVVLDANGNVQAQQSGRMTRAQVLAMLGAQ